MERSHTQNYPEFKAISESSNLSDVVKKNLQLILWEKLKNNPRDSDFSMLDVGSSDGEMSLPLAQWLKGNFGNFKYAALEPEKPSFEKLNERIQREGITYAENYSFTIEQYLNTKKRGGKNCLILSCSPMFFITYQKRDGTKSSQIP